MAKLALIFAHVFAASYLLSFVTPFPTDGSEEVTEELEAWLDSLYKMYQPVTPDHSQEQQFPQHPAQEHQMTQSTTLEPSGSQQQSQEQQLPHQYTQEQVNYIKDLLSKLKPENFNKEKIKELKQHLEEDSDEEQKPQETDDSNDDSDEETTTTTEKPTTTTGCATSPSTNEGTSTTTTRSTTTPTTQAPTTTTETTTKIITPEPFCFGYKPYEEDINYYLQFDGVYWLKMLCPYGFGFDYNACACSIRLSTPKPATTTTTEATTSTTEATTTTTPTTTPEATTTTTPTTTPEATTTTTTTTTQKSTTTVKPSLELCNDCVILHGVGYAPFPGYCDAYIQCRFYGDVPTAVSIRRCPYGQYWNQDKLTCDFEENVKCTPVNNCPNHKAIAGDWGAYLIFNGQSWLRVPCPSGTTYNSITCGCTDKHDDDDDNSSENCADKKAISGDKTGFLQITGNGWIRMPCPASVGYNEQTCGCTDKLDTDDSSHRCPDKKYIPEDKFGFLQFNGITWIRQPCPATLVYSPERCICTYDVPDDNDDSDSKDDDLCKPTVSLTFDNNDAADSSINEFWVNNTGVTFNDGKAYFNGKSRLIIPGLSNMELGSTVYIFIKYRHSSASTKQTLVANGDCQVRQSLAVCSGKESVDFYAETKEQLTLAKVTVPADIGVWQNVVYALDKDNLQGSVGANKVFQPIKGSLDRRQRGLVIGGGGDCDNFHGIIDDIQVFLCKPNF